MSADLYTRLGWLPKPPDDFKARCKALADSPGPAGEAIKALATHALDEQQLVHLSRAIAQRRISGLGLAPLLPLRLGIISNATTGLIVPAIIASAARYGLAVECVVADYDQMVQSALDPTSLINASRCHAVLVAIDHRALPLEAQHLGDAAAAGRQVEDALDKVAAIRNGVHVNSGAVCILQTVARPPETLFGSLDAVVSGTRSRLIGDFNRRLADSVGDGDVLLDVAGLAETVGLADWHDPTLWNLAKVPFSTAYVGLYADHIGRLLGALNGKSRRALILDLDNTVWSGVIGDDGLHGIVVGQGDPTGEAHLDLQAGALALRERGVVLSVSSKNDDDVARGPFRDHPDMLLREEHIAVFQANWSDKPSNIVAIADELALGRDAMVFVDDNPFERQFVRESVPMVAVPEMPEDPALYRRTLLAAGYFESVTFSSEDKGRADFYQDNAKRVRLQRNAGNLDDYLRSLDMVITFQPFDAIGRARITQLINKSNQYNLTTRRYTEADVEQLERDPAVFTLQVRLKDRFSDNGMISVVICRADGEDWTIDTWLMSCRVLGRQVEVAVLRELISRARAGGARDLIGQYCPTDRNGMVRDHYRTLGFSLVRERPDGETTWRLGTDTELAVVAPMSVVRLAMT